MSTGDESLVPAAETAIHQCLDLAPEESCVIVADSGTMAVAEALYGVAELVTDDLALVRYPPGDTHGAEPPTPVASVLASADVFLAPTTKSLSHTRARQRASEGGARGATMPEITIEIFQRGLDADYDLIASNCRDLRDQLDGAESIRVTTERGTDLTVTPGNRTWRSDTGIVHEPGAFSNLPAGEVFISPVTADGTVIIDGTMRPDGLLEVPIELEIEDGYVTDISHESIRETVEAAADAVGRAAYNVAELGIGANTGVSALVGSVLLDEKAAGTVHVAIGDDASIGGEVEAPIHLDGIVRDPLVFADGSRVNLPGAT